MTSSQLKINNTRYQILLTFLTTTLLVNANANSIGFDQSSYTGGTEISVTLVYDFTEFSMFGGGVDIEFDTSALNFTGFTQADLASDVDAPASPVGSLTSPGLYAGVGIGALGGFFNGINSASAIGTLTFEVLGPGDPNSTSCGFTLCVLPDSINPLVALSGDIVSNELIANGISGANVVVPVPAAVWLFLGGLAGLLGFSRKSGVS